MYNTFRKVKSNTTLFYVGFVFVFVFFVDAFVMFSLHEVKLYKVFASLERDSGPEQYNIILVTIIFTLLTRKLMTYQ